MQSSVSQNKGKGFPPKVEAAYAEIVDKLPVAVYTCDAEGHIDSYNEAAAELWGGYPELGKDLYSSVKVYCVEGSPLPVEKCPMNIILREGRSVNMEIIIERPDGSRRSVIPYPRAIYDDEGNISGAINTLIDITSQSIARKKLEESEYRSRFITDSIPHKVWTADAEGKVNYFNEQWLSYTGLTMEQLLDPNREPLLHIEDQEEHRRKWSHSLETGEPIEVEHRFRNYKGEYRWHLSKGQALRDEEGRITMWIGTSTDIEEEKLKKEDLEKVVADRTRELKKINSKLLSTIQTHEYAEDVGKFGSYRYNFHTKKIKYSDNFYRLLGCEPGEFPPGAEHFMKYVHPDDVEYLLNAQKEAMVDRKMAIWIYRLIRKDGEVIYVRGTCKFITNRRNITLMIGTLQDITAEKEQEEKLLQANLILESQNEVLVESEERFLKIFDNNPVAMTLSELKTKKIVYANRQFYDTFGYSREEIIGSSSEELKFVSPEESQRLTNLLLKHIQEDRSIEELKNLSLEEVEDMLVKIKESGFLNGIEVLYNRKNGESFYALVSYELIKIGNESYTISSCQDITDRKKAEQRLKASEEQFHRIIREVKDYAILSLNKNGIVENWNEGAKNIKGYAAEDIVGQYFGKFYTEEDRKAGLPEQLLILASENGRASNEGLRVRKDGSTFWANVIITALHDENGDIIGYSKFTRDLTAQKKADDELKYAYEQLKKQNEELKLMYKDLQEQKQALSNAEMKKQIAEQAVKSKQQFLANMSHEIRTPMNSIIGFTNVMLKTELTEEQKDHINAIKMSGDALLVIINDILDLAKVDAGRMVFEKIPFSVLDSVCGTIHLMDGKIREKNLTLVKDYAEAIPEMLVGDPVRLRQIILNLLSNAVKFTEKGTITVRVGVVGQGPEKVRLKFAVEDTGIGIPEDKLEHVFDSFEQASRDTARLYGGTGLGLAIVKKFVELQGGEIVVESSMGKGTCMSFELDFEKTTLLFEESEMNSPFNGYDLETTKSIRVLVVEDVFLNQLLVKIMLTDFGFDFDIVENGRLAIEKLQEEEYDVILMDLQMPEMNGFEATAYIRVQLKSDIPIIALTADVTSVDTDKSQAAGMNDYISKPIDEKLLYRKIMKYVNKNAAQD
ncbi:MAG: sensor hybrid histidine kinase [Crocinitomicaceae bacterium]|jgi:PAS domain S-box-containing protein|nr:sensor hybrid histidine kinase [Crocinitomicaceae bacterium]